MRISGTIYQSISLRRRVIISIGMLTILIVVIGLYGLMAILESNDRLHKSVVEAQVMASAIDTARLSQVHFKKQVQEWKNILLRGNEANLYDKHLKAFTEEEQKVQKYFTSLSQMIAASGLSVPQIAQVGVKHEMLGKRYREALAKHPRLDLRTAGQIDKSIRGLDRALTDEIDTIVEAIKSLTQKKLQETEKIAQTQINAYHALSFFIIFLIVAGIAFGVHNARAIIRILPSEKRNERQ